MQAVQDKREELLRVVLVRTRELRGKGDDVFLESAEPKVGLL